MGIERTKRLGEWLKDKPMADRVLNLATHACTLETELDRAVATLNQVAERLICHRLCDHWGQADWDAIEAARSIEKGGAK
jgi:hypothetical protein